jgi:hypothetical protein
MQVIQDAPLGMRRLDLELTAEHHVEVATWIAFPTDVLTREVASLLAGGGQEPQLAVRKPGGERSPRYPTSFLNRSRCG